MELSSLAGTWFASMERGCVEGSIAILLVWLVCRFLLQKAPASFRAALWWLACLKCLLAFLVSSSVLLPVLPARHAESATFSPRLSMTQHLGATKEPVEVSSTEAVEDAISTIPLGLFVVWALGVGGIGLWSLRQSLRFRALIRLGRPLDDLPIGAEVRVLGVQMGLRTVPRVVESDAVTSPVVFGSLAPRIVLPMGFDRALTEDERRMALAHELAHVRRGDLVASIVPCLCQVCFFFLPTVWLALRQLALEAEAACDFEALAITRAPASRYGEMLMKVVAADHLRHQYSALGATHSYHTLRKRLEMIQSTNRTNRGARVFAFCLIGLSLAMLVPLELSARTVSAPQPPAKLAQVGGETGKMSILCTVVDPDGKPVEGAEVMGQDNADPNRYDGGTGMGTNAAGQVTFTWDWSTYSRLSFRASKEDEFSDPKVKPINGTALIRLHRVRLGTVRGTIRDETGRPLSGAKVSALFDGTAPFCGNLNFLLGRPSGPDGTYRFDHLYPGFKIKIEAEEASRKTVSTPEILARPGKTLTAPDLKLLPKSG